MTLYDADLSLEGTPRHRFLLLKPEEAHEGVSGIVAGKVREITGFPCAVLSESQEAEGFLKGSARSVGKLDLISLFRRYSEMFERLGGHAAAAGFLILEEKENSLREALSRDLDAMLKEDPGLLDETEDADIEIDILDVVPELVEAIEKLSPFGNGNPKPVIRICVPADSIERIRYLSGEGKHIKFISGGVPFIFFGGGDTVFPESGAVEVFGCLDTNNWNGRREIQFAVKHINLI